MVKMKLNKEQKAFRKETRKWLFENGGFFVYSATDTFILCPQFLRSSVFSISTAICHPNDIYNRKYGEWQALVMWMEGNSVRVSRGFADEMCHLFDKG